MDVYLIPVAHDRYELYCEPGEDLDASVGEVPSKGRFAAIFANFKQTLARAEKQRLGEEPAAAGGSHSWSERVKDRMLAWIAERIAEQRLLWRLRNESQLTLHLADDMGADAAVTDARRQLQGEADRHFRWAIIDGLLFVASGAFFLVPGPNLIAYFFGFRLVGHYLSRRGAVHALTDVTWSTCPSPQLSRLRRVLRLAPHERAREVREVASALQLPHLVKFFERTTVKAA